ncbi:response regulator transcription factor [Larsenimonas suaedae]|uniref:Response regulator transcription factor n=1 Tax=Larsenimonas suaedae TaxID=1851019 RepID=A0ABU1GSV0_9GAMM|nr:response regulator transcription factor [Larsenimonas suaedae]MCM2972710.1 response regulator transcription factor [Larsenimonas suaedae]MDR5894493.1 response regulator transcription factor [Larsenimonas suaedae]
MTQESFVIVMVTSKNPQNELFLDYLRSEQDCQVMDLEPDAQEAAPDADRMLVLLDQDYVDDNIAQAWARRAHSDARIILSGFNIDSEEHAIQLMMRFPLQGIFYRRDPLKLISKGINALFNEEMWLSRTLMEKLLTAYWQRQRNDNMPFKSLTRREVEILQLLKTGASNFDIAQELSISEHTVKSHLYHIFRKLKVKNRAQALNLLRQQADTPV